MQIAGAFMCCEPAVRSCSDVDLHCAAALLYCYTASLLALLMINCTAVYVSAVYARGHMKMQPDDNQLLYGHLDSVRCTPRDLRDVIMRP